MALYNNVLAGVNIQGNRFFYVNVLEADGKKAFNHGRAGRSPWFGTACCPSNMARLIPQVPGMIYSHADNDIYCALYASSSAEVPLKTGRIKLKQQTDYPFDGTIEMEIEPENDGTEFTLWLRIPTWSTDRFVPGELYSYADNISTDASLYINGKQAKTKSIDGYVPVKRKWNKGDKVVLQLPMPIRYSSADERVEADRDRICITRGPLVYCAEQPDNEHPASNYIISQIGKEGRIEAFADGILKGIPRISLNASAIEGETELPATLTLIPYYAWNNRGDNVTMNVWFARHAETAAKEMIRTVDNIADVSATHTNGSDDVYAIADGQFPKSSSDNSIIRWTSWPQKGTAQQVEIKLKKESDVESVSVYWYDDQGGVQVPASWDMEYQANGQWNKFRLYSTDHYGILPDQFNMVHPAEAIKADALRLHIKPKPDSAVGILEVVIE